MKSLAISIFTAIVLVGSVIAPTQATEDGKVDFDQLRQENRDKEDGKVDR